MAGGRGRTSMKLSRSSNLLMMIVVAVAAAAADFANASELPSTPRILGQCKDKPFWREQIPPPPSTKHPHTQHIKCITSISFESNDG